MNEIRYFIRWGSHRLKSADPYSHGISSDQARSLHERRQIYTALVMQGDRPFAVIASNDGFFGVEFFDSKDREYLFYAFREKRPGALFLEQATFQTFQGEGETASGEEVYRFDPDGTHSEMVRDYGRQTMKTSDPRQVDVSGNWEPYPDFGRYDGLLRKER